MRNLALYRQLLAQNHWKQNGEDLSSDVSKWLLHTTSLTEKLQGICTQFNVELINEGWQDAADVDGKPNWVREVMLKGGNSDWIFAQTVLPKITIENVAQDVLSLGNNSIGLWLFPQNPQRLSLVWQRDPQTHLYSRYSRLHLHGYPIEIKELFLGNFPFER